MKTLLTATAFVLCMTAATNAATDITSYVFAGGPIYAPHQYIVFCEFINFGMPKVTPTSQQIFEAGSTTALTSTSSCANGTPVAPNQTCYILIEGGLPYEGLSCTVAFSQPTTHIRGALQLFDSSDNVLSTTELR